MTRETSMSSSNIQRCLTRKLGLLFATVFVCAFASAYVQIEISTVSTLPAVTEGSRILGTLGGLNMKSPQDEWERDLLAASQRSLGVVLTTATGPLVGMTTYKDAGSDVLVA